MKLYQRLATLVTARLNCIASASGNDEWRGKHEDEIGRLAKEHLPSGSGFDSGTILDLRKSKPNKLVLQTAFHHMDEHGGYDGWTSHAVTVTPDLVSGFDLKIHGRNRNDIKDYIAELFSHVLDEEVP
jgi:hypothetical protein